MPKQRKPKQHTLKKDRNGRIKTLYFAYGSNLNIEQMLARCPGAIPIATAVLHDYRLTYRGASRNYGVANIEPAEGHEVLGALYEIDERDLAALDRYEGYPTLYYRDDITVVAKGEEVNGDTKAFAYFMDPAKYRPSAPATTYFHTIWKGYNDWSLPTRRLEQVTTAWIEQGEGVEVV